MGETIFNMKDFPLMAEWGLQRPKKDLLTASFPKWSHLDLQNHFEDSYTSINWTGAGVKISSKNHTLNWYYCVGKPFPALPYSSTAILF